MSTSADALKRTLAFFDVLHYAPTRVELVSSAMQSAHTLIPSASDLYASVSDLCQNGQLREARGRVVFPDRLSLIDETQARTAFFPRKLRRAKQVARWLRRLGGIRFIALCNTMAMMNASDGSDLDFFIITKSNSIAQTRGWSTIPFKLLRLRPNAKHDDTDAICLSFFIDEQAINLEPLMEKPDDPYMRLWFLQLLPLFDDGIGCNVWQANQGWITRHHPHSEPWQSIPDAIEKPWLRLPALSIFEPTARRLQYLALSDRIRRQMNQSTDVIVNDHILKFHVEDGRETYRATWQAVCKARRIPL